MLPGLLPVGNRRETEALLEAMTEMALVEETEFLDEVHDRQSG